MKVVFRKCRDNGDIIAFFPEVTANYGNIMSYQHIGQHDEASLEFYYSTEKATPEEYKQLHNELISIYNDEVLEVRQRLHYDDLTHKAWKHDF